MYNIIMDLVLGIKRKEINLLKWINFTVNLRRSMSVRLFVCKKFIIKHFKQEPKNCNCVPDLKELTAPTWIFVLYKIVILLSIKRHTYQRHRNMSSIL